MDGIKKVDAFDREYFTPGTVILLTFNGPYHGFDGGQYHAIIAIRLGCFNSKPFQK